MVITCDNYESGVRSGRMFDDGILIQHLHDRQRYRLQEGSGIIQERYPEDYLVRGLIDFDDIRYDENAGLLYKLAGQSVARLRAYLAKEDDGINVL